MAIETNGTILSLPTISSREVGVSDFDKPSRYRNHTILEVDGVKVLESWRSPEVTTDDTDGILRVSLREGSRSDLSSKDSYQTKHLWWLIVLFSDMRDPFVDYTVEKEIRVPTINRVYSSIIAS